METLYDYCKEKNKEYLLQEWDYELNKDFDIKTILTGSHTKVWWKCSKCGYKWQIAIRNRVNGSHCPCCINKVAVEGINDLTTTHPEIAKEWHPTMNNGLTPQDITAGSNKDIWWICLHCENKWKTTVYHRAIKGSGCPKCRHSKRLNYGTKENLLFTHPEIAKDWHPTKNKKLKPEMFSKNSRYKIWWKCHVCGKEIETEIKNYSGCKTCKKQIILNNKNLSITHPQLLSEWDNNKNTIIKPVDVLASSPKKVWWKCVKCGYEWQAKISNRAVLGRGCPCCSNRVIVVGVNDLATTHPEIAKEWHPTKNKDLTPQKVTYGSNKKVWWLCPKGHEYQATIGHRTCGVGTNCPICNSGRQTSFAEQAVYYYVKKLYPDAINRYTADFLGRMELDIYIPSINYAIEYDGEPWHKGSAKLKREERKYILCKSKNIKLVRFREEEAPLTAFIADTQFCRDRLYEHSTLEHTIQLLLERLNFKSMGCPLDVNIERDRYEILKYKYELKKDTLLDKFPDVAKEWHPTKNGDLKPSMFKAGTDHKVWWLCPTCGNEYEAAINKRATNKNPTGCPKCGILKNSKKRMKAVNMIDIMTNQIIRTFDSISEAQKLTNIKNISMVCNGYREKAGGYKWSYVK